MERFALEDEDELEDESEADHKHDQAPYKISALLSYSEDALVK